MQAAATSARIPAATEEDRIAAAGVDEIVKEFEEGDLASLDDVAMRSWGLPEVAYERSHGRSGKRFPGIGVTSVAGVASHPCPLWMTRNCLDSTMNLHHCWRPG